MELCIQLAVFSYDDCENTEFYLIIIIKSEIWLICHCLGLGHETMICTLCLSIVLWKEHFYHLQCTSVRQKEIKLFNQPEYLVSEMTLQVYDNTQVESTRDKIQNANVFVHSYS